MSEPEAIGKVTLFNGSLLKYEENRAEKIGVLLTVSGYYLAAGPLFFALYSAETGDRCPELEMSSEMKVRRCHLLKLKPVRPNIK